MKFTKVIILASALALATFSSSSFAQAADSQTVVLPQTETDSAEDETLKVEGLKAKIGKFCFVTTSRLGREEIITEGKLKSVTTVWLVLERETKSTIQGKTYTSKMENYLLMKDVSSIEFQENSVK